MLAKRILNDVFTGPDGKTHDPARWLWIIGILAFLGFCGYEVIYRSGKFDMESFGLAYSALLGGGAAGVKIKESTEPTGTDSSEDDDDPPLPKPPKNT
jgi:hypothetical protein